MQYRKERLMALFVVFFSVAIIILGLSKLHYGSTLKIENESVIYFDHNWVAQTQGHMIPFEDNGLKSVQLDVEANQILQLERILPKAFESPQYIAIRASLQSIRICLDETEIYEHGQFEDSKGFHPVVSAWHLVKVPKMAMGKRLKIELMSPYPDLSGVVNPIFYGDYGSLSIEILKKHIAAFLPAALVTVIGFGMLVFAIFFRLPNRKRFAYLGLFALSIGLWMVSESRYIQFFTGSNFYMASSAFLMLSLFPIPLLLFVKEYIVVGFKPYYRFFIGVFALNTVFILVAALMGWYDFYETVRWTHLLIFLASVMMIGTLIYEIRLKRNIEAVHFTLALVVLAIFGIVEIIHFNFIAVISVSFWVRIGFLVFLIMLITHSVQQLLQLLKASVEATYYQRLAYEDRVTSGPNRTAFEEDIKMYFSNDERLKGLRVIIFDLNRLKLINDQFGHNEGDNAIRLTYQCIDKIFGRIGKCYRIGGDEFASLISGKQCDEAVYNQMKTDLEKCIDSVNQTLPYNFGISFGDAVYDIEQDHTFSTMMRRADQLMYEDKKRRTHYERAKASEFESKASHKDFKTAQYERKN